MEKAATAPREIKRKRSRLPGNKMTPLMAIIIVLLFIYFLLVAYPLFLDDLQLPEKLQGNLQEHLGDAQKSALE